LQKATHFGEINKDSSQGISQTLFPKLLLDYGSFVPLRTEPGTSTFTSGVWGSVSRTKDALLSGFWRDGQHSRLPRAGLQRWFRSKA